MEYDKRRKGLLFEVNKSENLEEIAATIAHEIKNPLAVALANLSLIKISSTDEKTEKYCNIIEKELYKINQLILEYINLKIINENEGSFDLLVILDELISEYKSRYDSINFYRKPDINFAICWGLPKHIRFVFTNILNYFVEGILRKGTIEINQKIIQNTLHITINANSVNLDAAELNTAIENDISKECYFCFLIIAKHGGQIQVLNNQEGTFKAIIKLPVYIKPDTQVKLSTVQ